MDTKKNALSKGDIVLVTGRNGIPPYQDEEHLPLSRERYQLMHNKLAIIDQVITGSPFPYEVLPLYRTENIAPLNYRTDELTFIVNKDDFEQVKGILNLSIARLIELMIYFEVSESAS